MGLKAGWLGLFIFVWLIGAFLGSTFEYQSAEGNAGVAYSTGTATFTTGSQWVTSGGGAVWTIAMEDGNIKADADTSWTKIKHVGGGYLQNGGGIVADTPLTLVVGANLITVDTLGNLIITLPVGNTGTATSGVCTVSGSPVALVAGTNVINCTGVVGTINIVTAGSTVMFLYSPYLGTGGVGVTYTMAVSPGWAGTGTAGYTTGQDPISTLEYLTDISNVFQKTQLLGNIPLPVPNGEYFKTAFNVVTWQWSFLADYQMFYWIFCTPFVIMGILSLILLVYGIISGNLTFT
jgi:hypothetical protein